VAGAVFVPSFKIALPTTEAHAPATTACFETIPGPPATGEYKRSLREMSISSVSEVADYGNGARDRCQVTILATRVSCLKAARARCRPVNIAADEAREPAEVEVRPIYSLYGMRKGAIHGVPHRDASR
jgi:hypothetical protein